MTAITSRPPHHEPKMAIEISDVRVAAELEWVRAETEYVHHAFIERLGRGKIGDRIDMVDAGHVSRLLSA
ncbi:MAG: hypothetical protein JWM91_536 [Rhodospirillales bacterium]|nr:hypothetical protein [Rhodospirillales bacterium]